MSNLRDEIAKLRVEADELADVLVKNIQRRQKDEKARNQRRLDILNQRIMTLDSIIALEDVTDDMANVKLSDDADKILAAARLDRDRVVDTLARITTEFLEKEANRQNFYREISATSQRNKGLAENAIADAQFVKARTAFSALVNECKVLETITVSRDTIDLIEKCVNELDEAFKLYIDANANVMTHLALIASDAKNTTQVVVSPGTPPSQPRTYIAEDVMPAMWAVGRLMVSVTNIVVQETVYVADETLSFAFNTTETPIVAVSRALAGGLSRLTSVGQAGALESVNLPQLTANGEPGQLSIEDITPKSKKTNDAVLIEDLDSGGSVKAATVANAMTRFSYKELD